MSALAIVPGAILAILLSVVSGWRSAGVATRWPTVTVPGAASGAAILAVVNLVAYNLMPGLERLGVASYRAGRYTQARGGSLTLPAWGERLGALAKAVALAISYQ